MEKLCSNSFCRNSFPKAWKGCAEMNFVKFSKKKFSRIWRTRAEMNFVKRASRKAFESCLQGKSMNWWLAEATYLANNDPVRQTIPNDTFLQIFLVDFVQQHHTHVGHLLVPGSASSSTDQFTAASRSTPPGALSWGCCLLNLRIDDEPISGKWLHSSIVAYSWPTRGLLVAHWALHLLLLLLHRLFCCCCFFFLLCWLVLRYSWATNRFIPEILQLSENHYCRNFL